MNDIRKSASALVLAAALGAGLTACGAAKPAASLSAAATEPAPAVTQGAPVSAAAGTMSLEEFNQIQNGMSYEEVQKIVGSAGTVLSESSIGGISIRIVSWLGNGSLGSNAAITFQNGAVSGKSQAGLV